MLLEKSDNNGIFGPCVNRTTIRGGTVRLYYLWRSGIIGIHSECLGEEAEILSKLLGGWAWITLWACASWKSSLRDSIITKAGVFWIKSAVFMLFSDFFLRPLECMKLSIIYSNVETLHNIRCYFLFLCRLLLFLLYYSNFELSVVVCLYPWPFKNNPLCFHSCSRFLHQEFIQ